MDITDARLYILTLTGTLRDDGNQATHHYSPDNHIRMNTSSFHKQLKRLIISVLNFRCRLSRNLQRNGIFFLACNRLNLRIDITKKHNF